MRKDKCRRSWSAGCGESYLSGAGSAGRNSTAERQHGRRPSTPSSYTFDAFRLEPPPGGLWRGDVRLALRPRSLAVLRYKAIELTGSCHTFPSVGPI